MAGSMKNLSIILACILVAFVACTKSKEVHPEIGDGNDENITVGMKEVHVEYTRSDIAELSKVLFHYGPADANGHAQQFATAEMTKNTTYFELTLHELLSDTLYWYYYELFPKDGEPSNTIQKTFRTQALEGPAPPTPPVAELPSVITTEVVEITTNSAQCGGKVTNDGGTAVTERGICWSTNANPTITNSHVSAGAGTGTFSAMMSGLSASTTYHVRAYATNEAGTAYGTDKEFTTLEGGGGGDVPEGAINGLFAINDNGDKVYFSQGNLQFQASTNTWRFAENQWNYVGGYDGEVYHGNVIGSDNGYASSTYSGWIDLFGWGTSGWNNGNVYYQPYDRAYLADWNAADFGYGYGPTDGANYNFNLTGDYSSADWGVYNPIINGGNQSGQWRTLTQPEWYFLLNSRITSSGIRFARAIVNNVCGLVLLPDDWNDSVYTFNYPNRTDAPYSTNEITTGTWSILENHGSVFLPAAGQYNSASSGYFNFEEGGFGGYWSATASATYFDYDTRDACLLELVASWGTYAPIDMSSVRYLGWSVRLVQDLN